MAPSSLPTQTSHSRWSRSNIIGSQTTSLSPESYTAHSIKSMYSHFRKFLSVLRRSGLWPPTLSSSSLLHSKIDFVPLPSTPPYYSDLIRLWITSTRSCPNFLPSCDGLQYIPLRSNIFLNDRGIELSSSWTRTPYQSLRDLIQGPSWLDLHTSQSVNVTQPTHRQISLDITKIKEKIRISDLPSSLEPPLVDFLSSVASSIEVTWPDKTKKLQVAIITRTSCTLTYFLPV